MPIRSGILNYAKERKVINHAHLILHGQSQVPNNAEI